MLGWWQPALGSTFENAKECILVGLASLENLTAIRAGTGWVWVVFTRSINQDLIAKNRWNFVVIWLGLRKKLLFFLWSFEFCTFLLFQWRLLWYLTQFSRKLHKKAGHFRLRIAWLPILSLFYFHWGPLCSPRGQSPRFDRRFHGVLRPTLWPFWTRPLKWCHKSRKQLWLLGNKGLRATWSVLGQPCPIFRSDKSLNWTLGRPSWGREPRRCSPGPWSPHLRICITNTRDSIIKCLEAREILVGNARLSNEYFAQKNELQADEAALGIGARRIGFHLGKDNDLKNLKEVLREIANCKNINRRSKTFKCLFWIRRGLSEAWVDLGKLQGEDGRSKEMNWCWMVQLSQMKSQA